MNTKKSQQMTLKKVKLTFSIIYIIFMSTRSVFGPFITIYLNEKGMSAKLIGIVTGINSLVIILSQPIWGVISDKISSTKKTLVVSIVAQSLFTISLLFVNDFFMIVMAFILYTASSSAEGTMLDLWTLESLKNVGDSKSIGQVKQWGTLGYALTSVLAGRFTAKYSVSAIIPIFIFLLLITAGLLLFIKPINVEVEKETKNVTIRDMQLGRILRDYKFLFFIGYTFFMQLGHRGSFTFYPLLIKQLGGDNSIVGYANALMFVSQFVIMFASKNLLKRFKPEHLVIASSFSFMLYQLAFRASTSPVHVVLACLMDGPSFAMFSLGALYYIDEIAPKDLRTTYQTIATSINFGMSGIIGNIGGGWLIENFGYKTLYNTAITTTFLSTVVFILIRYIIRNSEKKGSIL